MKVCTEIILVQDQFVVLAPPTMNSSVCWPLNTDQGVGKNKISRTQHSPPPSPLHLTHTLRVLNDQNNNSNPMDCQRHTSNPLPVPPASHSSSSTAAGTTCGDNKLLWTWFTNQHVNIPVLSSIYQFRFTMEMCNICSIFILYIFV